MPPEQGLSYNYISLVFQDSYGYIWIGTTVGLNKYDGVNFLTLESNFITSARIQCIYETANNQLLVGTACGLYIYNRETNTFSAYLDSNSISNNSINSIYEDSHGILWIGTVEGLNSYNPDTGKYTTYLNIADDINSISIFSNRFYCVSNNKR